VHGLTPFHQTELEAYLRDLGARTVVLGGVSTDVGVPGGALAADRAALAARYTGLAKRATWAIDVLE